MYPNEENMFILHDSKKIGDYNENPCLSLLMTDFNSKENCENKSFSCETKALISCVPMRRTCSWCQHRKDGGLL